DLARIPSKGVPEGCPTDLRRRVLIDNNPVSCVTNPGGAILIRDWLGDNPVDDELSRVRQQLEAILLEGKAVGNQHGEEEASNYAGHLCRLAAGHGDFRRRLQALGDQLDVEAPRE
ncbi:unnamed protein product, partial [Polarella glacialis]